MYSKKLLGTLDDRLGTSHGLRKALDKAFPDNWSFMIGEVALYAFVLLVATGTYLTFFFDASDRTVTYRGGYAPLRGTEMSEAYRSTVDLSLDVRAGLLIRQMHHWAALLFLAAIVLHLCRVFFTAAFRRPRELNWVIGLTMFVLALANGFTGYSLPDDLLSATGLRVAYSIAVSVPLAGPWLASLFFGGATITPVTTGRLYIIHVLFIPGLIAALLGAHLGILWRQKHTHFPGRGRREDNVVGSRLWPTYAARSVALLFLVAAMLAALGGLAQINPIWLYGPSQAGAVTTQAQPDWYLGWTEGALRLMPAVRFHVFGYRFPEVFIPGVLLPGMTIAVLYAWPFIERRITRDRDAHHLLDRPRDRPWRTGLGAAVLTFYVVLFGAGAEDIWADQLGVSVDLVRNGFRIALFVLPVLVGWFTTRTCRDLLAAVSRSEAFEHGEAPVGPVEDEAVDDGGPGGSGSGDDDDGDRTGSRAARAAEAAAAVAAGSVAAGALGYRWGRRRPKVIRIERNKGS
ncbi:MAG: cytochrome bc1 complex cytochrome b subunit [Acidimicrobiales bacterium]